MSEDLNKQVLGNIEEQHFDTDDFSSSTSSEPNTSSSASDEHKTSSGSSINDATNNNTISSRKELGTAPLAAAEAETMGTYDRNPLPKRNDHHQDKLWTGALFDGALLNENAESFPYTLKRMLDAETLSNPDTIRWLPAGDGFEGKW